MKVAIVGGGMAGTACAYWLSQAGAECVIYDPHGAVGQEGSGNPLGLYNPRFFAEYVPEAVFYKEAFDLAQGVLPELSDVDFRPCGVLHLMTNDQKRRRFEKMHASWPWDDADMRLVDAAEASEIAGVEVLHDALYLPRSGAVSPRALCRAYAGDVPVVQARIDNISDIDSDIVILACGTALAGITDLPLKAVRGQVTDVKANAVSAALKAALCYSGYIMPADAKGVHHCGSTFQRWLDHTDILPADDQDNIDKFCNAVPALTGGDYEVVSHRAGLRVAAPDHMPVIGHLTDNVYVSSAHGSHGILSSLMGGKILAAMITGGEAVLPTETLDTLSPRRF